jgi:hypothetical protein
MTAEEKQQLSGLLKWRLGAIELLKTIPDLVAKVKQLEADMKLLRPDTAKLGPKPKKEDRVPFAVIGEEIETAFDGVFRVPEGEDDTVEEWTTTDIARRLKLAYTSETMGRALRQMGVEQVVRRRKGKSVRLYRVVIR